MARMPVKMMPVRMAIVAAKCLQAPSCRGNRPSRADCGPAHGNECWWFTPTIQNHAPKKDCAANRMFSTLLMVLMVQYDW